MTNGNDPAFPKVPITQEDRGISWPGLTKREWLAGMAMQGILANSKYATEGTKLNGRILGVDEASLQLADALLAALRSSDKTEKSGE